MKTQRCAVVRIVISIAIVLSLRDAAEAASLYVGTQANALNWFITGAGATQSQALPYGGLQDEISITNTGTSIGTFISGGSLANFNGFWMANLQFFLPANATSVSLSFSGLKADDRAVLELNGAVIGNDALVGAGANVFSFPPGPPDGPFSFNNQTTGTITSGFNLGGANDLTLIVNNVNGGFFAPTSTFTSTSDGTHVGVDATVGYSVPEPSILGHVGVAFGLLGASRFRRQRSPS